MTSRKELSLLESMKLMQLIQDEYAAAGMSDGAFAEHAAQKLGFPVTANNVKNRRDALGIPATRARVPDASTLNVNERLEACERQLAADQKEFRGLTTLFLDLKSRFEILERAAKLKGTFERVES